MSTIDHNSRLAYLAGLEQAWGTIERHTPLGALVALPSVEKLTDALESWATTFNLEDEWVVAAARFVLVTLTSTPDLRYNTWPYEVPPCRPFRLDLTGLQGEWSPAAGQDPLQSIAEFQAQQRAIMQQQHRAARQAIHEQIGDRWRNTPQLAERFVLRQMGFSLGSIGAYAKISPPAVLEGIRVFADRTGSRLPDITAARRRKPAQLLTISRMEPAPLPKAA